MRSGLAMTRKAFAFGLVALVWVHSDALAQNPLPRSSPLVHPDRSVTFRLIAPQAREVAVRMANIAASTGRTHPMMQASDGTWSVTVGPFEPEIYEYSFVIDGTAVLDSGNPFTKPGDFAASLLEVPGSPPRIWESQDVAHGSLELLQYQSTPYKIRRNLYVYLPPQYYSEPLVRFPVLYLRHGNGDYEVSWPFQGRAGVILDNLIAQNRAVPMIIVMPYGESGATGGGTPEGIAKLDRELQEDIIPLVESRLRVVRERAGRAIAGLSMGGGQAATIGLRRLDQFAWIGVFSSGSPATGNTIDRFLPPLLESGDRLRQLRLLFLSCGTEDPRYPFHVAVLQNLGRNNVPYKWYSTAGGHEFKVWRHSLAEFLQLIFQKLATG